MKEKVKKKRIKSVDGKAKVLKPFEDLIDLSSLVRFKLRGRDVGAFLLSKGQGRYTFVFGFECEGIHSYLLSDQLDAIFDGVESGIKELPEGERFIVHLGAFSSDRDRQNQLKDLISKAPFSEAQFLLTGERARIRELTQLGLREPKFLRLYATYTIEPNQQGTEDFAEKILAKLENAWNWYNDEDDEISNQELTRIVKSALTDGYYLWEQLLSTKMGLTIRPLTAQGLWEGVWRRFNNSDPIPVPQCLTLDEEGLSEQINSELHSVTKLLADQVPVFDRQWVNVRGKYVGALTFLDKPGGWSNKGMQLRYLWDLLARDVVVDTEIFCELTPANPMLVKTAVQRLLKQSNVTAIVAQEKRSVDVAAGVKTERSIDAQRKLYEGAVPLHTAVTILVHRPSTERLDEACRYIESCFRRPAWVAREREYAWKIWLETLPITWDPMLTKPFNRRLVYLSSEVLGLTPLMCTRNRDRQGFELISEDGGSPVFLDMFEKHRNLGIFATTRAGKSVLVSGILTQALAYGMPVVALDYPKPDGTSTFTDYTHFMGNNGAYFDIGREANNLFEMPDLRHLPLEKQQERFYDYRDFLASALMTLVAADGEKQSINQTIRAILNLALTQFFEDPIIQQRYQSAANEGFGSEAWNSTPTLRDFLRFCTKEHLPLDKVSGGNVDIALQQLQVRLQFWLDSRVGRAISQPSSFPTTAPLLVFALRNLNDSEDAAILSLSAYSAALRRALESPASIFFIDESPILFKFPEISSLVGRLCANGAKAGIRVILSGQDPNTIANSNAGSQIFQNLSTRLIGRIQPNAIRSFEAIMEYPRELISYNATEQFVPKKQGIFSRWLLDDSGVLTPCRYYPAYVQLAAVANNPEEQSARDKFLEKYEDKYEGLTKFSNFLIDCIKNDKNPYKALPERF